MKYISSLCFCLLSIQWKKLLLCVKTVAIFGDALVQQTKLPFCVVVFNRLKNIFICRLVECCDGGLYWSNRLEVDFIEIGYGVDNILKATQKLCGFLQTESLSYCIGKITINLVN